MNKTSLIAIIVVVILAAAFGAGLWMLLKDNEQYEIGKIRITVNGEEIGVYGDLAELADITSFNAVYKPNNKQPVARTYEGFELKAVLEAVGIDVSAIKSVAFRASDGQSKLYAGADIRKEKEVFVAVKYDGKAFIAGINKKVPSYPEEDGGPFVVIRASDAVSQNRLRCLVEINVVLQ